MPLEMKLIACLSTGHVDRDTAAELDALTEFPPPLRILYGPATWQGQVVAERWQEYGWFVWIKSPGRDAMPESLRACLDFTEAAGAEWIQFDRDCTPIAGLQSYDW